MRADRFGSTALRPRHVVVMGVSGSGKSAVAAQLADALACALAEGDELHPAANVAKMRARQPLTDADRAPWLAAIAAWVRARDANGESTVVACSALKRRYRDVLRTAAARVCFVHLDVPPDMLRQRLGRRLHFMPVDLLASQLRDLEALERDEPGFAVDAARPLDAVVADVVERLAPNAA